MDPIPLAALETCALALLVAIAAVVLGAGSSRGDLQRPTYGAGDQWVYVLQGSLAGFPGLNRSEGNISLGLSGLVEVDVLGPAQAVVAGLAVPGIRVGTQASGFLNGTFAIPGNGTVRASGTFSSATTEVWEDQDDLPTLSNSTSTYTLSVTLGIPVSVSAQVWVNTTTSYGSLPPFNLSVGESAAVPFTADLAVVTSASFLGFSARNESKGTATGLWMRHVLDAGNVRVEAGTFAAYRMDQSLGAFAGLGVAVPTEGANETAWFSNDVGYYVKRQAFVNGTPVAEMRLKSYAYPATPPTLSLLEGSLLVGLPVAAVAAVLLLLRRRRRRGAGTTTGTAGPVGELPPKPPGGGP